MWKLPTLELRSSATAETDLVFVFQKAQKPFSPRSRYSTLVERLSKADGLSGQEGQMIFVRGGGRGKARNVLVVGAGSPASLNEEKLRVLGGKAFAKLAAEKVKAVSVQLDGCLEAVKGSEGLGAGAIAGCFAEGLVLSAYKFEKYKSKSGSKSGEYGGLGAIVFVMAAKGAKAGLKAAIAEIKDALRAARAMAEATQVTRDWSNEPSNFGTPEYYAAEAKRLAAQYGLKCTILKEEDAKKQKMGLFLAVGQGSTREGRVVVVEYNPPSPRKTLAFVGKGVTFDSGGISIKPSLRMEEMKHDMTGAATVMGAVLLASKLKARNRVVAIMAFTENMPAGNALQPGNVIEGRNGKTVEIFNTDAEGRLILGDVLDYAHEFKPDAIIDVATLTGAVTVALGKMCAAVLGNDDGLIGEIRGAADRAGEKIWQLPLFDEYFEDLKSEVADMKNSANDGAGGTIRGAVFLKQFIRKGTRWAHLDIAATAWNVGHIAYFPKRGASGAYVRTLARLAMELGE